MSILTPAQIEQLWRGEDDPYTFVWTPEMIRSVRDTLAAYAVPVQKVADLDETEMCDMETGRCPFCHRFPFPGGDPAWADTHADDCAYTLSRKLRRQ
jgi:hypothetical protein